MRKFFFIFVVAVLLIGAAGISTAPAENVGSASGNMPPNEMLIMEALRERGVIPANATADEALEIYQNYIKQKLAGGEERGNPVAAASLKKEEAKGKPENKHGQLRPNNQRFDNVLTLLVEFAGEDEGHVGPLHNEMPAPGPDDNTTFWVEDFNAEHYNDMLFDKTPGARSMYNFYLEQSGQKYAVDGRAYGWVAVEHSEWWYGADSESGHDNLNGPVWRVVQDAAIIACDVPWKDYDKEDPYDLDGDGVFSEPDGYVDHIQLVHAGADQSGGGGAQGDDAIWAHSWWADEGTHGPGYGGVPTCDPEVWVGPYTINPEDGTIGVFVHEFGHDLGLPDQYDTIYSGEASTGFWTLMSSGSWLGCPGEALGTCPASLNVWEKWVLGWLDPITIYPGETKNNILLKQATSTGPSNKAIQIRLPAYDYSEVLNVPYSGMYEWYSGSGADFNHTLTGEFVLPAGAQLSFWTWYDIEEDWDYGFVEVSTNGVDWVTLPGNITTDTDPNGQNDGYGITGSSGDWIEATFDLSSYGGQTIFLRFRYFTDAYVNNPGWTIDDIRIDTFFDDVEVGVGSWGADGWYRTTGTESGTANHYYMVEWRTPTGFDVSMNNWYNYMYGNTAEFVKASPGMLVWYRNLRYTDNHVGVHPWAGQLLLVDAHPQLFDDGLYYPFRTRLQIADAAFGLTPTPEQLLTSWSGYPTVAYIPALDPVSTFDDSITYVDDYFAPYLGMGYTWLENAISSVYTPQYGLKINVKGMTPNAGKINVDFSGFVP